MSMVGVSVRLELAFGKSAASRLGHQAAFDLWRLEDALYGARQNQPGARAGSKRMFPIR